MSKILKVIFTVSVLLNIAFVGVLSGHYAKKMKKWDSFHSDLAPETVSLLKQTFADHKDQMRENRKKTRQKMSTITEILNAEHFDENAFRDAVRDWSGLHNEITKQKTEVMVGLVNRLSVEERRKVSKRFVQVLSGKTGRHGKGRKAAFDKVINSKKTQEE